MSYIASDIVRHLITGGVVRIKTDGFSFSASAVDKLYVFGIIKLSGVEILGKKLTWKEVFKRDDIVGGDNEEQDGGQVFRGPIKSIILQPDGSYCIELEWCARLDPESGEWKKWAITQSFVNDKETQPSDIGDGRIGYYRIMCGPGVIFPKGGSKLDPSKVKDLKILLRSTLPTA
jgi:hypothetical protein